MTYDHYLSLRASAQQQIALWEQRLQLVAGEGVQIEGSVISLAAGRESYDQPRTVYVVAVYVTVEWTARSVDSEGEATESQGTEPRHFFGYITTDPTLPAQLFATGAFDFTWGQSSSDAGSTTRTANFTFETRGFVLGYESGFDWEKGVYLRSVRLHFDVVNENDPAQTEFGEQLRIDSTAATFEGRPGAQEAFFRLRPTGLSFS